MEALMHAQLSRDLGEAVEGIGDVDWLRASGMVGRRHPVALAVWRLVELQDRRAFPEALRGVLALALRLDLDEPVMSTSAVLQYLTDSLCRACRGRGFAVVPGTPYLGDEACQDCGGGGRRDPGFSEDEDRLHEAVKRLQREAAAAVMAAMR